MEHETEENEPMEVATIADDNLLEIVQKAEQRIEAVNKIKRLALRVTNYLDWTDHNGKLRLGGSGSEKVGELFGVCWQLSEPVREDEAGGHFLFTYKGKFSRSGRKIEVIGTASSKDGFFKRYKYEKGKEPFELPPCEIDKGDVKKKAMTNCIGNGVTRILGIRNLTYDDLKDAGIDISKIEKIDYTGKKEMSDEGKSTKEKAHNMMVEMHGKDYGAKLLELTSFTTKGGDKVKGKDSLEGLSEKWLQSTYGKIKEQYQKFKPAAGEKKSADKGKSKTDSGKEKMTGRDELIAEVKDQQERVGNVAFIGETKKFKGKNYHVDYTDEDIEALRMKLCKLPDKK